MELRDLFRVLSSEANLRILSLLSTRAMNPRELAKLLDRDESDVSRRLKVLEKAGLVEGRWVRVGGRNVRMYSLRVEELKIHLNTGEISLEGMAEGYSLSLEERRPIVSVFVGRKEEIKKLKERKEPLLVIYGMAGIGKTTLAAKAFSQAFWYYVTGEESIEHFFWKAGMFLQSVGYEELLEYLRSSGGNEEILVELLREGIEKTRIIIVIDDVHRNEDLLRILRLVTRGLENGKIVLTSRVKPPLGLDGVFYLRLGGLKPDEAYDLALIKGGSMTPEEFAELYRITRGHPLALNLLFEGIHRGKPWDRENFFEFLFEEIYLSLSQQERTLLGIMACFEEPLEYEALKRLYSGKGLFLALHSLLSKGLVERIGRGYTVHEIVRSFAREVSGVSPEGYYRSYAYYLLLEKDSPEAFLRAFRYLLKAGDRDRLKELTEIRLRKFREIVAEFPKTYMKLLQMAGNDPYVEAEKAEVDFNRGFFDRAEKAWLHVKDNIGGIHKANVLTFLVDLYLEKEEVGKAKKYLKESRKLAEELNDPLAWLWYQMEETKYLYYSGRIREALESAFREVEFAQKAETRPDVKALIFLHIGDILITLDKLGEALEYYKRAKEILEAYGMEFRANVALLEIAKAYYRLGKFKEASEFARNAADYFIRIRNYRRAVDSMAYLAVSLIGLDSLDDAERVSREMIKIGQATEYPLSWAGYIFLGAVKNLRGEEGSGYFILGRKHLEDNLRLYDAILESLSRVFDVEGTFGQRLSKEES